MKSFRLALERFCIKRPGFGISRLMLYIVGVSGAVYLLMLILQQEARLTMLFEPSLILRGQVWRLITWIFLPTQSFGGMGLFFMLIAMYFYYWIGTTLEGAWGKGMFTLYYLIGVLAHIIYGFIIYFATGYWFTYIDPVYLNLSMFFAFAMINPDHRILLFLIIPVKIKWVAILNAVFFGYGIISDLASGQYITAFFPVIALINFMMFCGDELIYHIRRMTGRMKQNRSPGVINFKKAAKQHRKNMKDKPYRHICAVCGKTDTEFPSLEFRYCSLCQGYHCFCEEHIDNHVHFRE